MANNWTAVFHADTSGVTSAFAQMQQASAQVTGQMQSAFGGLQAVFSRVQGAFAALAAVLAGGEAFRQGVEAVEDMEEAAKRLARQLGVNAHEAHVLNTAMGNNFINADTYSTAQKTVTKALVNNEDAFRKMGIQVRDSHGQLLPMQQIIVNTVSGLGQFKAGVDQNAMAMQLLGKGYEEVLPLMKLTPAAMAEAEEEIRSLHKEVDPAAWQAYKVAMENAGDSIEGVMINIGRAVLPGLTQLGSWFGEIGPGLVQATIAVMGLLGEAFDAVMIPVSELWQGISSACSAIGEAVGLTFGGQPLTLLQFFENSIKVLRIAFIGLRVGIQLAMEIVREVVMDVVAAVIIAWVGFRQAIATSIEVVSGYVKALGATLQTFAKVAGAALEGDFDGAVAAWKAGTARVETIVKESAKRIKDISAEAARDRAAAAAKAPTLSGQVRYDQIAAQGQADIAGVLNPTPAAPSASAFAKPPSGDQLAFGLDDKPAAAAPASSVIPELERQLTEKKAIWAQEHDGRDMDLQSQLSYWEKVLAGMRLSASDRAAVQRKLADLNLKIAQESHLKAYEDEVAEWKSLHALTNDGQEVSKQQELAYWRDEIASRKLSAADRLAVDRKIMELEIQTRKQAHDQQRALTEQDIDFRREMKLKDLELEGEAADQQLALGYITAEQRVNIQRELEEARYQAELQGVNDRLALSGLEEKDRQALKNRLLLLEKEHQQKVSQLAFQQASQQDATWTALRDRMSSLWDQGMQAMLNGTLTWKNAMRAIGAQVVGWFATDVVGKKVKAWALGEATQTGATRAGALERLAIRTWEAIKSIAIAAWEGIKKVAIYAWEAMAGAYAAIASIPYVGPVLAPVAAGVAFAGVIKLASNIASASGGYDIPAGVNPLTQLHEKEMVLPAHIAEPMRENLASGGLGGGQHVHYHDNTGTLTPEQIRRNVRVIAQELNRLGKNGWRV